MVSERCLVALRNCAPFCPCMMHLSGSCFVSDDLWGGAEEAMFVARLIADYLVQAWDLRNGCKHTGAVLPSPTAPVGRGADGDVAMA